MKKFFKTNLNIKNMLLIISNILITILIMVMNVFFGNNKTWGNSLFLASLITLCGIVLYVIFARTVFFERFRLNMYNNKNQKILDKKLYLPSEKDSLKRIDINDFKKIIAKKTWFNIIFLVSLQTILIAISLILIYM